MAKTKSKKRRLVIQAIEYLVSGGAYFIVGYLLLDYFYYVLHWSLWWSTITSNIVGWSVNFTLQRYWAFRNPHLKENLAQVTTRYMVVTIVDFLMNYYILLVLKNAGITPAIGQFISSAFFTVWNYIWYRWWVFPERIPAPHHPARRHIRPHHLR
ncbi:MAG TPA: GtrA family protein [Candidatus Saccharimonadales bacterium]|nr:GtrA family protein [Candidatus Saccharimonadales bacterium]